MTESVAKFTRQTRAEYGNVVIRETEIASDGAERITTELMSPVRARIRARHLLACADCADAQMPRVPR